MAIVAIFHSPTLTQKNYEDSVQRLTGGRRRRMESPADWPVPGLVVHVAGQGPNGFRVVDVWESEAAFQRFGEKLGPILKDLGIEGEPEIYRTHALVTA